MRIRYYFVITGVAISLFQTCFAFTGSTNYSITCNVISCAGLPIGSASLNSMGTLGQPSSIKSVNSTNYNLDSGFWYTLPLVSIWDFEPDGDVDGLDLWEFIEGSDGFNSSDLDSFSLEFGIAD